jgi:hypothetical protein
VYTFCIAINLHRDHNVLIALLGPDGKLTRLIWGNGLSHVIDGGENITFFVSPEGNNICNFEGLAGSLRGTKILTGLAFVLASRSLAHVCVGPWLPLASVLDERDLLPAVFISRTN